MESGTKKSAVKVLKRAIHPMLTLPTEWGAVVVEMLKLANRLWGSSKC